MKTILPSTEILSANEIEIHYKRPLFTSMKYIKCVDDVNILIRELVNQNQIDFKEFFWVVLLNRANRVLGISQIAVGASSGVSVSIKEVCQLALLTCSTAIAIIHNHPSGALTPSKADHNITVKIKKALQLFNITLPKQRDVILWSSFLV